MLRDAKIDDSELIAFEETDKLICRGCFAKQNTPEGIVWSIFGCNVIYFFSYLPHTGRMLGN